MDDIQTVSIMTVSVAICLSDSLFIELHCAITPFVSDSDNRLNSFLSSSDVIEKNCFDFYCGVRRVLLLRSISRHFQASLQLWQTVLRLSCLTFAPAGNGVLRTTL